MKLAKFALILIVPLMVSGFGYMGDLPRLGEETREFKETKPTQTQEIKKPHPLSIIAPRVSTGYNVNKYKDYLADIQEIEDLLKEIKAILEEEANPKNKIQHFNAKSFVLGLYVDRFREKYEDGPEKYYESYKQLVFVDDYLKQVGFSNADDAITPINTVIEIIAEAKTQGL